LAAEFGPSPDDTLSGYYGLGWLLSNPSDAVADTLLRFARKGEEVSQGKTLLLRSGAVGFTCARVRMMIGRPRPWPGYPAAPALYPLSVRRLRAWP